MVLTSRASRDVKCVSVNFAICCFQGQAFARTSFGAHVYELRQPVSGHGAIRLELMRHVGNIGRDLSKAAQSLNKVRNART